MIFNFSDAEVEFIRKIIKFQNLKELDRLGKLFNTEMNNYFYDNGTGKVITFDDEIYNIFRLLFQCDKKIDYDDFVNCKYDFSENSLREFVNIVMNENLLQAPKIERLYAYTHHEGLEDQLNNNLQQVILELTGKCNLRCGYCIYNDQYNLNRVFNENEMTQDIAKLAIDYGNNHSRDKIAVTFYGGEPLLNFELLKWCIEYSLKTIKNKELSFSLTTNLTLVTNEIAEYLASVPKLSVVCSMDGPHDIHNLYRKYKNGVGSFEKAIIGLEKLSKAFSKTGNFLSINTVFAPPYTYKKLDKIKNFFDSLEWLPKSTELNITYPVKGSINDEYKEFEKISNNPKYLSNIEKKIDPLWIWNKREIMLCNKLDEVDKTVLVGDKVKILLKMHKRFISDKPVGIYPFNSCCVPGSRRLYIDTKGDFYVCERIGTSPSIGNVYNGIDIDSVKKYYVDEYETYTQECTNCWALRICDACYCNTYTKDGFNKKEREELCKIFKSSAEQSLILYHSIYEFSPEKLDCLNEWEVS